MVRGHPLQNVEHEGVGCLGQRVQLLRRAAYPPSCRPPGRAGAFGPALKEATRFQNGHLRGHSRARDAGQLDELQLGSRRSSAGLEDLISEVLGEQSEELSRPMMHLLLLSRMSKRSEKVQPAPHLALVSPPVAEPEATVAADSVRYLTTTRCRPSELPQTMSLRLEPKALQLARTAARTSGLEVSAWVRLAVECARQAARAACMLGFSVADVQSLVDRASAESPRTQPVAVAPLAAYVRALCAGAADDDGARSLGEPLLVPVPDELVVAWSAAATEAGTSLDAWASVQVLNAPRGVVAWEAAAARRGFYLGEWVLAVSASSSASRSKALPHV
jgi:hypothetical protein